MSELSREEVIRKIGDAVKLVGELCSGGRKWTMSVPARPDYDPDLIIGGALDAALRALSQPPDSEQEQCSYCKQWFSKPVSYHHSTDECRAAELWSKENLTVAEVAELERLPIWPPEKPDSEAVRLLREATIPPAKTEIAWIDRLAAHYGARQMAALRGDKALWNDRDHWLSLTAQDHWHEILEALRAHPARQPAAQSVDIVFDGPPGHEAGRFVEVESPPGKSISFGQWLQRDDGYWVLRINGQPAAQSERRKGERRTCPEAIRGNWVAAHGIERRFNHENRRRQSAAQSDATPQKCKCGQMEIPAHADGVSWYWQLHKRDLCTLELPDKHCWCGLLRSEHIAGHADSYGQPAAREPEGQWDIDTVVKPFERSRFGIFHPDGRFEELTNDDWDSHPRASTARWIGGPTDAETIRAAMLRASSPTEGEPK